MHLKIIVQQITTGCFKQIRYRDKCEHVLFRKITNEEQAKTDCKGE